MARMDLSDRTVFGEDIDFVDAISSQDEEKKAEKSITKERTLKPGAKPKRFKIDAQNRVIIVQIALAAAMIALFLAVKFLFPTLHETLSGQYDDFNSKPPIFDLSNIKQIVAPETALILPDDGPWCSADLC